MTDYAKVDDITIHNYECVSGWERSVKSQKIPTDTAQMTADHNRLQTTNDTAISYRHCDIVLYIETL